VGEVGGSELLGGDLTVLPYKQVRLETAALGKVFKCSQTDMKPK
jgi:hypothetical protein